MVRADPLAERARVTPDDLALVDGESGEGWTYGDLNDAVTALGAGLPTVDAGDRVGVLLETSIEAVLAVHAGLRLGATVVPLNPEEGARTLRSHLDRASPAIVIGHDGADLPAGSGDDPPLVPIEALGDDGSASASLPRWDWGDPMLLLFTSGTTGTPKPVTLTAANILASAAASAFRLGVLPSDNWVCCLPIHHMGGLAPILRSTLYGTAITVHEGFDSGAVGATIAAGDPTGISVVPTQLRRLLSADAPLDRLRVVLLGGAPAPPGLIDRCKRADVPVHPTYGLTETASQVTTATPAEAFAHPGTVGRPLLGTTVTVVDDDGAAVPDGTRGEIVVEGPTVTPGYADGSDLRTGTHGFHTGDVGYLEDGRLWVTGRLGDVIITGGERVHPSHVEDAIRTHPAVEDAAVVGLDDPEWGERVAALVVADDVSMATLDAHVAERLAPYEVPKTWKPTDALPRTASGTIDREAVRRRLRGVNNPDSR